MFYDHVPDDLSAAPVDHIDVGLAVLGPSNVVFEEPGRGKSENRADRTNVMDQFRPALIHKVAHIRKIIWVELSELPALEPDLFVLLTATLSSFHGLALVAVNRPLCHLSCFLYQNRYWSI